MALKFYAAGLCAVAIGAIGVIALAGQPAEAAQKKKSVTTGQSQVVPSRARTRITVQRRSFLDGGTELLPGERKFTDYAIPPTYSPTGPIDNTAFSRPPLPGFPNYSRGW